jgi:hypothetical protein
MSLKIYDPEKQARIRHNEEEGYFPLSYSRMDRYEDCPRWYHYENIEKLGRIGGEAADLGNALHKFQEILFSDGIEEANKLATAMVPLSASEEWANAKKIIEKIVLKKDHLYSAETPYRWEFEVKKKDGTSVIVQFEAKIDQFFVFYDDGIGEIIDGKSGRKVTENIENNPQGLAYGVSVIEALPDLDLHKIIFTQAQWRYGRLVSTSFTIDELHNYKMQIEAKAEQMVNDTEFAPKPGNQCMWCPFALRCDAAQKMLPKLVEFHGTILPPIISDDSDAQKVAAGVIHLETILKLYRASLQGFVREFGTPVTLGEKTYDFHKHKTWKIENLKTLVGIAEENEIDLSNVISYNNQTGKTLLKKHPELKDAMYEDQWSKFEYAAPEDEED